MIEKRPRVRSEASSAQVCHVIPPHIIERVAVRGSPAQRERAVRALQLDASIRSARVGLSEARPRGLRTAKRVWRQVRPWLAPPDTPEERTIYDARHRQGLPGLEVRSEGDRPTGDPAVDEAYDGLGATFDLYLDAYGRDSINDAGLPLNGSVHYGRDYDNAFWNGRQMVFGDGDGDLFNRFTVSVDVIGHELAHGVTEDEAGLIYWAQSGALNESISDVFGSLVKQYANDQKAKDADWLIGAGLLTDKVDGEALRSMKAPGTAYDDPVLGKDPQPGHMDDYVRTVEDNGAVHTNSGIPNRAFYLAAVAIGGYAWEVAGLIWYETLISPQLGRNAQFGTFAALTVSTAARLFPDLPDTEAAVADAWAEVGIRV